MLSNTWLVSERHSFHDNCHGAPYQSRNDQQRLNRHVSIARVHC